MNWIKEIKKEFREIKITDKALFSFGLIFFIFFLVIFFIRFFRGNISPVFILLAALFLLAGIFLKKSLTGPYKSWIFFGILLNFIMTRVILILLYFLIVTPTGIILRLMKKDILKLKISENKTSYWEDFKNPADKNQYLKQF